MRVSAAIWRCIPRGPVAWQMLVKDTSTSSTMQQHISRSPLEPSSKSQCQPAGSGTRASLASQAWHKRHLCRAPGNRFNADKNAYSGSSLGLTRLGQVTVDSRSAFACLLLLLAPVALIGLLVPAGRMHNFPKKCGCCRWQQRLCMSGAALCKAQPAHS